MKILSPDGRLCVEVGLERQAGRGRCFFRALLGRHVVVARSEIAAPSAPKEEVVTRELVGRDGRVLARELSVRFPGGRCLFRVADDAFAVIPLGRGLRPVPSLPATISRGYWPSVASDGRLRCGACGPAGCRRIVESHRGLLFYANGTCAAVVSGGLAGLFVMTAASRPVDAVLPRGMRHLLCGLPEEGRGNREEGTGNGEEGTGNGERGTGNGEFSILNSQFSISSVDAFFLRFGYIFDAWRAAGIPVNAEPATFVPDLSVTPVHAEAYAILSDPARGEAAAGFRGEMGEYVCGARRLGRMWFVAGITAKLRVLTLFFPYLEEGVRYRAEWTLDEGADLPTNAVNPTPACISAGDKAMVRMNQDGGFVLRLEPMD